MTSLRRLPIVAVACLLALASGAGAAALPAQPAAPAGGSVAGTAFTYQGRLNDGGQPANGVYDFEFKLYDAATNGNLHPDEVLLQDVNVAGGLFTVSLDFGDGAFTGEARWLDIGVRPGASAGAFTPLLPRQPLTAAPLALSLPGLYTEPNATSPNVIGGWAGNYVEPNMVGATIGGGGAANGDGNGVLSNYSTVGGGRGNQAGPSLNALAPSGDPIPSGSTVGGGEYNLATGINATIGGGHSNTASGNDATVGGGQSNTAAGFSAAVAGGWTNSASGFYAAVGGGYTNLAGATAAVVAGGSGNTISTTADYGFIGGGQDNLVSGDWGIIAGGQSNTITVGGEHAAIGGGTSNIASDQAATVGGGGNNEASFSGATVGGGHFNLADGPNATVGGGQNNVADSSIATVGGGNSNDALAIATTIGGGNVNIATAVYGTVAGGLGNAAEDEAVAVGGGRFNTASGEAATVGGGDSNTTSADYATVGGGSGNTASGLGATVPGGLDNSATMTASLAAGSDALAVHQGAFVWADGAGVPFTSTASNQFLVRASGGVGLGTNAPDGQLHVSSGGGVSSPQVSISQTVAGNQFARLRFQQAGKNTFWDIAIGGTDHVFNIYSGTTGSGANILSLTPNDATDLLLMSNGARLTQGGAWTNASDRNLKTAFAPIDPARILDTLAGLPLYTWQYRAEPDSVRHLGPTAQDFRAAFGLGADDTSITTLDADGVALAAIQALHAENESLQARLAALEARAPSVPLPWLLLGGLGLLNVGYLVGRRGRLGKLGRG